MRTSSSPSSLYDRHVANSFLGCLYYPMTALIAAAALAWGLGIIPPRQARAGTEFSQSEQPAPSTAFEAMFSESPPLRGRSYILEGTRARAQAAAGSFASCIVRLTVAVNRLTDNDSHRVIIGGFTGNSDDPTAPCTATIHLTQGHQSRNCTIEAPDMADSRLTCFTPVPLRDSATSRPTYRIGSY